MIELNTERDLRTQLFLSIVQCIIGSWFVFYNIYYSQLIFLVFLLVPAILTILFIVIIIGLDLTKKDYMVLQAKLIEKEHNKIIVEDLQGNIKKFRLKNKHIRDFREKDILKIKYFKRSKAVIKIKTITKHE